MDIMCLGKNKDLNVKIENGYAVFLNDKFKKHEDIFSKTKIKTNSEGHEFFEILNPYEMNSNFDKFSGMFFYNLHGYAIQSVFDGYSDAILKSALDITPIRFIDRNIGDAMRNKTMEGFNDFKYEWVLVCFYGFMSEEILYSKQFKTCEEAFEYKNNKGDELIEKIRNDYKMKNIELHLSVRQVVI